MFCGRVYRFKERSRNEENWGTSAWTETEKNKEINKIGPCWNRTDLY